jgi:hypothetical protein
MSWNAQAVRHKKTEMRLKGCALNPPAGKKLGFNGFLKKLKLNHI